MHHQSDYLVDQFECTQITTFKKSPFGECKMGLIVVTLFIVVREQAPYISQPLPQQIYKQEGLALMLSCPIRGQPSPTLQWFYQSGQ